MYYAWILFEKRLKDVYLPGASKWTEKITVYQSESGWDRDYSITIRFLEGELFLSPPEEFHWRETTNNRKEVRVLTGKTYGMVNGSFRINALFTECIPEDTIFRKYRMGSGTTVTLGRAENCVMRIVPQFQTVSGNQGAFQIKADGTGVYTDNSKNGSYLNGLRLTSNSALLRFGDILTLSEGVKFVYLGNMLAVNRMSVFADIKLEEAVPQEKEEAGEDRTSVPHVQIQHHRAPRLLPKANNEEIRIEPPLEKKENQNLPLWLSIGPSTTMVLPMLMGSAISSARGTFMGAGLAMVGTASMLAVFWGLLNQRYRRNQAEEIEQARVEKYALYISQAEEYLRQLGEREYKRLQETCPNVRICAALPQSHSYRLWERMPKHADFMAVRLGLGDVPIPNKIAIDDVRLNAIDDPLRDEPSRLADTYGKIPNAPLTISIRQEAIIGILGDTVATSLAQSILLQLAALHSYHDVRIAVITDEGQRSQWAWTRWLPHVFSSEDRELRMVVSVDYAIQEVLTHLDEVLQMRRESSRETGSDDDDEALPLPHYVIFCTKPELLENKPLLRHLITKSWGMTLILLAPSMEMLPKECRIVVSARENQGKMYFADGDMQSVELEYLNQELMKSFAHMLAPLRVKDSVESAAIPSMVSFLGIYGVRDAGMLDIWRFWNENHVYEGIRSIIGLGSGSRPFVLDISDKSHGPHGLVAGTTGSGKSVMLQTYILSLAVNYHPDQVRFILIDYKGGGMADSFRTLPHVTGVIDNLQTGNTIARALASIHGEIHRREEIFHRTGVSSIDDYIRFFYDDPAEERLPHLIIIVDEFAELKSDQPEFMQELISASRVGRSLGVHLILSTQKPSNSVSDEIWANSNFRICLRVQSRSDSMEMLRHPDAAYLKTRGRCYIQVGNDEIYEQAQTSYSGMKYDPTEPSAEEQPHLLDDAGRTVAVKASKRKQSIRETTQMDAVMERIAQVASEHGISQARSLWMDELGSTIYLNSVIREAGETGELWAGPATGTELKTLFAMADDVESQRHFPVWLDLMNNRNYVIVGMASTGKTTLLQTLMVSFALRYSPAALQMYVLSLSGRTLENLAALPHVGEVVCAEETDELHRLLRLLQREDQRRKKLFAAASTDSFVEYNRSRSMNHLDPVPAIVVFADRFSQVMECIQNDDAWVQLFYGLIREGSARGIYFVVSAMKLNEIPFKVRDCFKGIGLQINDRADYTEIVGMRMPSDMPDLATYTGRGLVQVDGQLFEMQVALAGTSDSDVERAAELSALAEQMNQSWKGIRPARIARIPEHPGLKEFIQSPVYQEIISDVMHFSFAYSVETGLPLSINAGSNYTYLAVGGKKTGKTSFLQLLAALWKRRGARIGIAASEEWADFCRSESLQRYDLKSKEWERYVAWLNEEIKRRAGLRKAAQAEGAQALDRTVRSLEPVVIIIDDLDSFINKNPDVANRLFAEIALRAAHFGIYLYAAISHNGYAQYRMQEPLLTLVRQQRGVALGGRISECDPWNVQMPYAKKSAAFPLGEALLIENGELSRIIIPRVE